MGLAWENANASILVPLWLAVCDRTSENMRQTWSDLLTQERHEIKNQSPQAPKCKASTFTQPNQISISMEQRRATFGIDANLALSLTTAAHPWTLKKAQAHAS